MIAAISLQGILLIGVAGTLFFCGVLTLVNIALFGFNLKIYTELMKDRNMAARSRTATETPAKPS